MSGAGDASTLGARLWRDCLATQEVLCIYLGLQLNLYEALRDRPATANELADRAGIAPRYAREWLEQQAVSGVLGFDGARFALPDGHAEVLTLSDSLHSRVASILPVGGVAAALPALLEAYRTGTGVPDADFGEPWRDGHANANRALFAHVLPGWLRSAAPDIDRRLRSAGARAADVACGAGWASISLARAYPELQITGFDVDPELIAMATANARDAGLSDRVLFTREDCTGDPPLRDLDLVCAFDVLHEIPRPVELLGYCRALLGPRGSTLVMDARVAEAFGAPADEVERFQYTTSLLHCLPTCMAERPSAETGTVMRRASVAAFARAAGFRQTLSLPSRDRFHALYRLIP